MPADFPRPIPPLFGLTEARARPDIDLPGSPQRAAARWAVEDDTGQVYVLERLRPGQAKHRRVLARILDHLAEQDLETVPYLRTPDADLDNGPVLHTDQGDFQLSPYLDHEPLDRPDFLGHEERGRCLGRWLAKLDQAGQSVPDDLAAALPRLDLPGYATDLRQAIAARRPDVLPRLDPVLAALAPLFEAWPDLPAPLRHGDFHPLNVLWRGQGVLAVIDWEFCGPKPELFDAANMLGCCGFEHPRAFGAGLVPALVREIRGQGLLTPANASFLPHLVLGLRLAWLSEWLRTKDQNMLAQELDYLDLLAGSLSDMARAWPG